MNSRIEYLEDGVSVDWAEVAFGTVRLFTERESGPHELFLSPYAIKRLANKLQPADESSGAPAQDLLASTMAATLEEVAVRLWRTGSPDLCELACSIEGVVRRVNPSFALMTIIDEESALYAQALKNADCAPADAGEDNASGLQSR